MTAVDYDTIIDEGFGAWVERYYARAAARRGGGLRRLRADTARRLRGLAREGDRRLLARRHDHPLRVLLRRALHAAVHARPAPSAGQGPGRHGRVHAVPQGADAPAHPRLLAHGPVDRGLARGERVPLAAPLGALRVPLLQGAGRRGRSRRGPSLSCTSTPTGRATSSGSASSPRASACSPSTARPTSSRPRRCWATTCASWATCRPACCRWAPRRRSTDYSHRLIREIGPGGFILAQGCDIPPDAKYENVKAMMDAVQQ